MFLFWWLTSSKEVLFRGHTWSHVFWTCPNSRVAAKCAGPEGYVLEGHFKDMYIDNIVKLKRVLNMSGTWIQISVNRDLLFEVSKVGVWKTRLRIRWDPTEKKYLKVCSTQRSLLQISGTILKKANLNLDLWELYFEKTRWLSKSLEHNWSPGPIMMRGICDFLRGG